MARFFFFMVFVLFRRVSRLLRPLLGTGLSVWRGKTNECHEQTATRPVWSGQTKLRAPCCLSPQSPVTRGNGPRSARQKRRPARPRSPIKKPPATVSTLPSRFAARIVNHVHKHPQTRTLKVHNGVAAVGQSVEIKQRRASQPHADMTGELTSVHVSLSNVKPPRVLARIGTFLVTDPAQRPNRFDKSLIHSPQQISCRAYTSNHGSSVRFQADLR